MTAATSTDAAARRERYERLLRIVECNTFRPDQPAGPKAGVRAVEVAQIASHAGLDELATTTRQYLRRAAKNGDVVAWTDAAGDERWSRATLVGLWAVVDQHRRTGDPVEQELRRAVLPALRDLDGGEE